MDQGEEKPRHPLTGEPYDEEEERSRLQVIENGKFPSTEIQVKFAEFISTIYKGRGERRVSPQKLFTAYLYKQEWGDHFLRFYYDRNDSDQRGFTCRKMLDFYKKNEEINYISIRLHGETQNVPYEELDKSTLDFINDNADETLKVGLTIKSRKLVLDFDNKGELRGINFNSDMKSHSDPDIVLFMTKEYIDLIKKTNKSFKQKIRYSNVKLNFDHDTNSIIFERSEDGEIKDTVNIPIEIDLTKIEDMLLTESLKKDPLTADTDEDIQWQDFNFGKLGIEWQRD